MECEVAVLIPHSAFRIPHLFVFSMQPMTAAAAAELVELEPSGRVLLILSRHVVPLFALGAL